MLEEVREVTGSPMLARGPGPLMPQEGTCSDLGGLPESGGIAVDGFGQNRFLGVCSWLFSSFFLSPGNFLLHIPVSPHAPMSLLFIQVSMLRGRLEHPV